MDAREKLKKIGKDSILKSLLVLMAAVWFGTYFLESGYNVFWAGSAGMHAMVFLVLAMLADVLL